MTVIDLAVESTAISIFVPGISFNVSASCATIDVEPTLTVLKASLIDPEPSAPLGMPKSKTAADVEPTLVTVAFDPEGSVVTVPTVIVAAAPDGPALPGSPWAPLNPLN